MGRRPLEELARPRRTQEEQTGREGHEQRRKEARGQALEVVEEALEAQEAEEADPYRDGEHDAPGMPAGAEPPRERAEEDGNLGEEEKVGEALHL